MKDPETKVAMEGWQTTMSAVMGKLVSDPELKDLFAEIKEEGVGAWKKFREDERVVQKIAAVQKELNGELIAEQETRELKEEMVKEIFAKFDEDKDGFLSLAEFNALQLVTEG